MPVNTRSSTARGGYKTRSALRVFTPSSTTSQHQYNTRQAAAGSKYNQPLRKIAKKTGKPGSCFEQHETTPTGKYFDLGEGYYAYLGFFRNEIGLHIRVYQQDSDFETGLRPTKEGCVIWGHNPIVYFLDLAPFVIDEFKKCNEDLLRHPIEDSDLFVLIGREYGEIRISVRRMSRNKSSECKTSYTASITGASLSTTMWQALVDCIPDIRKTLYELQQYAPVDAETNTETMVDDDSRISDNIIKWSINTAVMEEIRGYLEAEFAECTDKIVLLSAVSKVFNDLKLNDLVCSVYKRSRHLLRGYTVDTIENMVRNCYSDNGKKTIVDMMVSN